MESCDDIFLNARELADAGERAAYLDKACGNDASLRQRVEAMLRDAEGAGEFFGAEKTVVLAMPGASPKSPLATVRYIGDYELQEEIGRGGMGVVYKARQVTLNRTVAVKMIIAGVYAGPDERRRFQREAEAAAQLRHPNIVAIHEVGEHEGRSYFSMDYIEGQTLSAQLKEGKLPPARAAALVKTLAEAVHFAHQRGTLHRDLKPQNILIGTDGQPHILDFGLARPVEREAGLTRTGDVMGSPSYMPPEQATGRIGDIGPATDVYALGAILYEAITGSPPFTGETAMEVLSQVIDNEPSPPRKVNPAVPADLETICLKCLEKRPERRYHSARALAEELERFLNFEPILARPASRLRKGWSWAQRNPWVFAAGFGLATLVLVCVAYGLWEQTQLLHWRLEVDKPQTAPPRDLDYNLRTAITPMEINRRTMPVQGESPAIKFYFFLPAVALLLQFVGRAFHKMYRRQTKEGIPVSERALLLHALAGVGAVVLGIGYLLLQTRWWMWHSPAWPYLPLEIAGIICALMLGGIGIWMVWEAAGIHETSRYRGLVNKFLDQQLARESQPGPVFKRIRFVLVLLRALLALALVVWLGAAVVLLTSGIGVSGMARVPASVGVVLNTALVLALVWAIRKRRQVSTFVCIPLALAGFAFAFVGPTAKFDKVGCSFLLYLFGAVATGLALYLFKSRKPSSQGKPRGFLASPWFDTAYGVALVIGSIVLIHVVEDWRGRVAWEKCEHNFEAKGAKLDWSAYIPSPVPDDQNVFKAPKMQEWFTERGSKPLADLLDGTAPWSVSNRTGSNVTVAFVTLAKSGHMPSGDATVLWYGDTNIRTSAWRVITNAISPVLITPRGSALMAQATGKLQPPKIILECDHNLTAREVGAIVPESLGSPAVWWTGRLLVQADGLDAFRIAAEGLYSPSDVMAWQQKCESQLEIVRQGLQRPIARMGGNYFNPIELPIPSFVSIRAVSHMLGTLAQSDLLRGDPENALRQLTFMHDVRRLVEGPPGGQPETLVAAMIDVSLAGVYVNVVHDGLRLQAWRDPQLAALEGQLAEIDLPLYLERSFESDRAWVPQLLELMRQAHHTTDWDYLTTPKARNTGRRIVDTLLPTGWLNQNKVSWVETYPNIKEAFDLQHHLLFPRIFEEEQKRHERESQSGFLPYTWFGNIAMPNYVRASQTTASNQTMVVQARVACALERFRLAHNEYPQSLNALVPRFIDQIPNDIIGGQKPVYNAYADGEYRLSSAGWKEDERWTWPPPLNP
jgi:predicted Ser/Thr protein kinase